MNSKDLTLEQLQQIHDRALADLERYAKFRLWLKERRFPGTDPLLIRIEKAHQELMALRMHLHYELGEAEQRG